MGQKGEKLIPVHEQDLLNGNGFVRIGNEDFENMEAFVLHHLPVVSQQVHTYLQMLATVNVCGHDAIVRPVQEDLAEELDRLPFSNITIRLNQDVVVFVKEQVEIGRQISGYQLLVSSE